MNLVEIYSKPEWEREPDELFFEYRGYQCAILRGPLKNLCGYFGVTKDDPLFLFDGSYINVHGGITFSGEGHEGFLPAVDKDGKFLWWLGFDCGHAGDLIPGMIEERVKITSHLQERFSSIDFSLALRNDVYRNIAYVKNELINAIEDVEAANLIGT